MITLVRERRLQTPPVETRRTTPSLWKTLIGALLVLALAFAAGALTMRAFDTEVAGLADASVVELVESSVEATNAGDEAAVAALLSADAELFYLDSGVELGSVEFAKAIAAELVTFEDFALTSDMVQHGDYASATYAEATTEGLLVVEVVDGKIGNLWLFVEEYK